MDDVPVPDAAGQRHLDDRDGHGPRPAVRDPAERYPDAAALAADLESWKDLDLSWFVFAAEKPGLPTSGRRGPILLVAGISLGFIAASTLFILLVALLQRH